MNLPNQLAYKRSLHPGPAVFFYEDAEGKRYPLTIERTKIRGSKSGFAEAYQVKKDKAAESGINISLKPDATTQKLSSGNPHTIDTCYLPPEAETLICKFSLRIVANSLKPDTCSDAECWNSLTHFTALYKKAGGYFELAGRYAKNILSGAWLWRNRDTAAFEITVETSEGNTYTLPNAHLQFPDIPWKKDAAKILKGLTTEVETALASPRYYWSAEITARLKPGFCAEIFPSQCFTDQSDSDASKVLATINYQGTQTACMTADKVNAAIQLVDNWYSDDPNAISLRVNEYGSDSHRNIAYRHPSTQLDFYTLLQGIDEQISVLEKAKSLKDIPASIHYITSVLTKGGMFQGGKSK